MKPKSRTESTKSKLCHSIIEQAESEVLETGDIEKRLNNVKDPGEAAKLINKMDKMINIQKNNILTIAGKQGEISKMFKTDIKFMSTVKKFNISKATINFKIGIVEFINMYFRIKKMCISLYYLKNNFRIIKEICKKRCF